MASSISRIGRRRRVLNEEVLTASAMGIAARSRDDFSRMPGDTPRYGAGANIENHPQVTDYVPRRYRVVALGVVASVGLGLCAELVASHAEQLSHLVGTVTPVEITTAIADGLVAWVSTVALLITACFARIVYSLRRHRVDDSRGRYRVWRLLATVSVVLSANAFMGGHAIVARMAGHLTGWSVLPGSVGWWLAPAAILGGWLLVKLMIESSECRLALTAFALSLVCFSAAGVAHLWLPLFAVPWHDTLTRELPMLGDILLAAGTLLFARYVVLDVQGLIEHAPAPEPARSALAGTPRKPETDSSLRIEAAPAAQTDAWTDGTDADDDYEESRPLSKADRKRLRREKSRNRAA